MAHLGDFKLGTTIYAKFTTAAASTGAPTQLAGTPVVSVYENDDNTQITAGVTLGVDEDGVTGLNQLEIVASAANGYEVGKFYDAVITTGTVGGTSAVGYVVASFTIEAAGLNASNMTLSAGPSIPLGIIDSGTLQSATATTAVLRAAASFADDRLNGMTIQITGGTGIGQARVITDYVNATDTATVDTWTTTPDNTSTYVVLGTPPVASAITTNITGNITGNLSGSVGSVTGNVGGDVVGDVQGNVDGSVGSVTGDIGGLAAGAITDVETATAASLAAAGITTDGVTRIAAVDLAVGGAAPSSPIGEAP